MRDRDCLVGDVDQLAGLVGARLDGVLDQLDQALGLRAALLQVADQLLGVGELEHRAGRI